MYHQLSFCRYVTLAVQNFLKILMHVHLQEPTNGWLQRYNSHMYSHMYSQLVYSLVFVYPIPDSQEGTSIFLL